MNALAVAGLLCLIVAGVTISRRASRTHASDATPSVVSSRQTPTADSQQPLPARDANQPDGTLASDRFPYTSTAALRASDLYDQTESRMALMSLDTAVRYDGHPTARSDMPAFESGLGMLAVPVPRLKNVWLRVVLRFSPGFTTAGRLTSTANSLKLIGWGWAGDDGRGDLEITNTTEYQLHWNVPGAPFVSVNAGVVDEEWSDGKWRVFVIHYQATSGTTTRTRAWIGLPGGKLTLRATANGVGHALGVREFAWPFYFNQSRRLKQAIWTGEWTLVDGSANANPFGVR